MWNICVHFVFYWKLSELSRNEEGWHRDIKASSLCMNFLQGKNSFSKNVEAVECQLIAINQTLSASQQKIIGDSIFFHSFNKLNIPHEQSQKKAEKLKEGKKYFTANLSVLINSPAVTWHFASHITRNILFAFSPRLRNVVHIIFESLSSSDVIGSGEFADGEMCVCRSVYSRFYLFSIFFIIY